MRLVRASGQAARSPERELPGPQRAVQDSACGRKTALTHRLFFSGRSWGYINNYLQHAQFLSTYRSVRLHRNPSIIFFERKLDGIAPISVRVIASVLLTAERQTVSPSRNPCDSNPFWSQLTIDVRLHENQFLYARSRMKRHLRC